MKRVAFAVPGNLAALTGGYGYDRRMIAELRKLGWETEVIELGDGFPKPSDEVKSSAAARLQQIQQGCPIIVDGLALGVLPDAARQLATSHRLIALVHHPLAFETGLAADQAEAMFKSERDALAWVRGVVVTSASTATLLTEDYDVPPEAITVASPGTDRAAFAAGSGAESLRLLSVGSIVPRKGFDVLVAALAEISHLPWHLTIAGDRERDRKAAAELDADIVRHDLSARIDVLGAVPEDRLAELYSGADLFVLASRFEGYGMAFAEALARGLPIIATTAGAISDTVPPGAGILVEPNDVKALARTLQLVIENPKERQWLADGARTAAAQLPGWPDQANIFSAAIEAAA